MGVRFESPTPNSVPLWNRVTTEPGHPYRMIWSSANSTSRESPSGPLATISKVSSGASLYCSPQGSREKVRAIERELHTRNEVMYSLVSGSSGMTVTSAAGVRRPIALILLGRRHWDCLGFWPTRCGRNLSTLPPCLGSDQHVQVPRG